MPASNKYPVQILINPTSLRMLIRPPQIVHIDNLANDIEARIELLTIKNIEFFIICGTFSHMDYDDRRVDELKKAADSYTSLIELVDKLQEGYRELSEKFDVQSGQLEDINSQLSDAVAVNSQLSAYLNNILEYLDAGVIVLDNKGQINLFNEAAENLTGIKRDKALARNYREVFAGDEHKSTFDLLKGDEKKVRGEKWFGSQPVGYSSSRIYARNGEMYGVVEILYDLMAEKKLRETIRHVSALAAVGEMAATIAHQIRNPLAGIIGFADLLKRDLGDNHESIRLVEKISRGSMELNKIITSLLDYTKKTEPDFRDLDLVKFIKDTVKSLAKEKYAVKTKFDIKSKRGKVMYRFDPLLMHQAIANIVHNACQAMEPDGGTLRLAIIAENDKSLKITFADSGKGLSRGEAGKIFKPFFTTRSDGVGLGLSMVKKAIDFHNGELQAFNDDKGGAVFVIKLPL